MSGKQEKRWQIRVVHIRDEISYIHGFVEGMTYEHFKDDIKTIHAVIRGFQVMGEASKLVPEEIKAKFPTVAWKHLARFRDVLVHDYDQVDLQMTWEVIHQELPKLKIEIDKIPLNKEV